MGPHIGLSRYMGGDRVQTQMGVLSGPHSGRPQKRTHVGNSHGASMEPMDSSIRGPIFQPMYILDGPHIQTLAGKT